MPPHVELACPHCRARLSFAPHLAGASGPCYACGQTVVVPSAAPPVPQPAMVRAAEGPAPAPPPRGPSSPHLSVAPTRLQQQTAESIAKEAAKSGMQMLGMRVLQTGREVSHRENFGAALFGGSIRVDTAQAMKIRSPSGDFFVFVPWSGNMMLAHELASVLPGGLPSCLVLSRGLLGAWSSGRYEGSNGAERDPLAVAAEPDYELHRGIEWNWESGRLRIKLHWGLQAVPFDTTAAGPRTLHVVHTAQQGIVFRDFGLRWYLDRQRGFYDFIRKVGYAGPPPKRAWSPAPIAALFLDDFYL